MLPGSMLPPGVQLAATDRRGAPADDEESLAQRHGHVVHMPRTETPRRAALVGSPLILILVLLVLQLTG